jgi:hypothetical protein
MMEHSRRRRPALPACLRASPRDIPRGTRRRARREAKEMRLLALPRLRAAEGDGAAGYGGTLLDDK